MTSDWTVNYEFLKRVQKRIASWPDWKRNVTLRGEVTLRGNVTLRGEVTSPSNSQATSLLSGVSPVEVENVLRDSV